MKHLRPYFRGYRRDAALAPLFKMLEAFLELFVPLVVKRIIDVGLPAGERGAIVKDCLLLAALALVGLCFSVTAQFFAARCAVGFSAGLRGALFSHINGLGYPEIDRLGTSALITRLTNDVSQVQNGVNLFLRLLLRSPFVVFGAVFMAFTVDAPSALVFAVAVPLLAAAVFGFLLGSMPLYKRVQQRLDRLLSAARENLKGVRVLRAFGKEPEEIARFSAEADALARANLRAGRVSALTSPVTYVILNLAIVLLIWKGAVRVNGGEMTRGAVVALYNYMSQILIELVKLANLIITLSRAAASARRIDGIFELSPSIRYPETGARPDYDAPAVEFRNVSLSYGDNSEPSLRALSFSAGRGERLGVIGSTGAGKTSVVNLIPRFYDATAGEVRVFGRNVREYDAPTLAGLVSVVPQKAVLFSGTLRENLKWGAPEATDEELLEALRLAQAADILQKKPEGLDAVIEQGGANLSGGQRQRLTVARALLKRAPILILDDSASALDFATEKRLRTALEALPERPLVITVSQRATSVMRCDQILVLEEGALSGAGTHAELLEADPVYREIFACSGAAAEQGGAL